MIGRRAAALAALALVAAGCGGQADEDHCREELLAKLKSCCGGAADEHTSQ